MRCSKKRYLRNGGVFSKVAIFQMVRQSTGGENY
jgi:hypothetical protein